MGNTRCKIISSIEVDEGLPVCEGHILQLKKGSSAKCISGRGSKKMFRKVNRDNNIDMYV
jgi:hypothetical protein